MQPDVAGMQVAGNEKRDEKTKMQNAEKMRKKKRQQNEGRWKKVASNQPTGVVMKNRPAI